LITNHEQRHNQALEENMKKLERITLLIMLGAVLPILGLLVGWWSLVGVIPDAMIPIPAVTGFSLGILLDIFFLKKWMAAAYQAGWWLWGLIYIFYAVGIFGFFMGVPVFNLLLGIPAGILLAGRLVYKQVQKTEADKAARNGAWVSTFVLLIACVASAGLALNDPYTAANLEGMFALPFTVSTSMLWGLILIGGLSILVIQWLITRISTGLSYRLLSKQI
jgi:hypothetical protein